MAVILIAVAILINCKPNDIDKSSEGASEDSVVVIDAPEGAGPEVGGPDISEEELAALLATSEPVEGTPTPMPQVSGEVETREPSETTPTATPAESPSAGIGAEAEAATPTPTREPKIAEGPLAPELTGVTAWINSQPLKISDLRGKVTLVDFWTYTCVNCIRTFPYLKVWHAKYADDGLVILGVHTPEFTFERKLENVRQAVKKHGIGWAVALDNDYATWGAYENRYWPAKYLIDKDGVIRYTHFGEGAYTGTESKIRELLEEAGADLTVLDSGLPNDQVLDPGFLKDPSARPTRELYAGWERGFSDILSGSRGYVGDRRYWDDQDTVVDYEAPDNLREHLIYLQGPWYNGTESLRHARETSGYEDYLALRFSAQKCQCRYQTSRGWS